MTDITPDFNVYLKENNAQLVVQKDYNIEAINSFLQEAYNIVRANKIWLCTALTDHTEFANCRTHS